MPPGSPIPCEEDGAEPEFARPKRARFLDCDIDRVTMDQAVALCERYIDTGTPAQNVAINAAKVTGLRNDPALRLIVRGCELVTADGMAVVWASRLLGDPLPERVSGIDLMHRLLGLAEQKGYRVYILGAKQPVLARAVARIREDHPALVVAGYRDGYFDDSEAMAVARKIERARPDILFVAISSPRKEFFLGRYRGVMNVPLVLGVGGSIDIVAGITKRAPVLIQRLGLEWLFRIVQEPRRMFGRYLRTNPRFILMVAREALARRLGSRVAARRRRI